MAPSDKGGDSVTERTEGDATPNPVWFKPIMFGLMLLGLVWVLVFYLSNMQFPIPGIDAWNLVIGFGIAFIGFLMTTRWR
ncbi:cell division protein CrgA [Microbacterium sp. Sa4CUA7]|uniref:Cell division protein CrgA n=1 Tax=Microbacterium pullorum TaxID=2762236 RepID=A0ABR8S504_9MICO|nr:cell division protein CrgA [Microbacterium pullorum]MBD7958459.1 cell division protein CrgA [Microbacterium pullorum]